MKKPTYKVDKAIGTTHRWFVVEVDKWGFERIIAECATKHWATRIEWMLNNQ